MPSIRKRLKKLASSKKSKSTSDLDNIGEPSSHSVGDDDTRSYISEAASERTDASLSESTYSYASRSEEGKKKKKRKLKISLTKKKKKEVLVKDPQGNVVFRSLSVEHDSRGVSQQNMPGEESLLEPKNVEASTSIGSNVERDDSSETDEWRMSGLLETVNRASNTSLNDNLLSTFEERRQMLAGKANAESTPIKDGVLAGVAASPEGEKVDEKDGKLEKFLMPSHEEKISFSPYGGLGTEIGQALEAAGECNKHLLQEDEVGSSDEDCLVGFRRDLEPVQEEDFTEMRNVDPESEIDIDRPVMDYETMGKGNHIFEELPEVEKEMGDKLLQVIGEKSVVCDAGHGKKVIIRHLNEVVSCANIELSETVNMEDWIVLNIEKDDWVLVGYSKVGGEIINLFEQSVDTV